MVSRSATVFVDSGIFGGRANVVYMSSEGGGTGSRTGRPAGGIRRATRWKVWISAESRV